MAVRSNKFPAWFIVFVLFSFLVSVADSSASGECADGTYEHDGRQCCLCAAGHYLVKHCAARPSDRECGMCDTGMYTSSPNKQDRCDPCTSCSHPNANLEEAESCTPAQDRKCRCKEDHYCSSGIEVCKLCRPCGKCGAEGIKKRCTGHNDTVCNEKIEGGNKVGITVGVVVVIAVIAVLIGIGVFIKKRRTRKPMAVVLKSVKSDAMELQPLKVVPPEVDLQRHLPDIAKVMTWPDMRDIAMHSGITQAEIDSCEQNHPHHRQEQTFELLKIWVEKQGIKASKNLIEWLEKRDKRGTAEKVVKILRDDNNTSES